MDVLSSGHAEIYDIEQIVVRGRLTLNVLVGLAAEQATIRDLLFFGWEEGLHIEFEVVDTTPTKPKSLSIVTVIGTSVGPGDFGWQQRSPGAGETSNAFFGCPDTR